MNNNYKSIIEKTLGHTKGDYKEIRIEESVSTRINYNGKVRENVSINSHFGGSVRSLSKGGWGFASFNDITKAPEKMKAATDLANYSNNPKITLKESAPKKVSLPAEIKKDPRKISLSEKIEITDHYKDSKFADLPESYIDARLSNFTAVKGCNSEQAAKLNQVNIVKYVVECLVGVKPLNFFENKSYFSFNEKSPDYGKVFRVH